MSFACGSSSKNCNGLLNFHSCMLELVYTMGWSQSAQYRRPNMSTQVVRSGIRCWTLIWSYWTYQELPNFVSVCALSQRDKPKNTRYMAFILATCIFVFDSCLLCSKHTCMAWPIDWVFPCGVVGSSRSRTRHAIKLGIWLLPAQPV